MIRKLDDMFYDEDPKKYVRITIFTEERMAESAGVSPEDAGLILDWMRFPKVMLKTGKLGYLVCFERID